MLEMRPGDCIRGIRMDRDLHNEIDPARRHHGEASREVIDEPDLRVFQTMQGEVALCYPLMGAASGAKRREDAMRTVQLEMEARRDRTA